MIVKCMLPISIVEKDAFKDYISFFNPSLANEFPSRFRIKETGLPELKKVVQNRIATVLAGLNSVNISSDGWSDGIMRCFNGYTAQGIDDNWNLINFTIGFEYVTGKHTGVNIKKQFDEVCKRFNIEKKIFKTVADQAANMKKAFYSFLESSEIVGGVDDYNVIKTTKLLIEKRRQLDVLEQQKEKEAVLRLNKEIDLANANTCTQQKITSYMKKDQVLAELDDITDELSESEDEEDKDEEKQINEY
jgi:hypothetical protein